MIQVGDVVRHHDKLFEIIKSEIRYEQFVFIGKSITHNRKCNFYMHSIEKMTLILKKEITPCKLN